MSDQAALGDGDTRRRHARVRVQTRPSRDRLPPGAARAVGIAGFAAAAIVPALVWHRTIADLAQSSRFDLPNVVAWSGFALLLVGLVLFVPVLFSLGRSPESRFYPYARNAYVGWGAALYVLGVALASQVSEIAAGVSGH